MYDELLERAKERVAKEEERRRAARKEFTALLRETRGVTSASTWDATRASVEGAPEYKAVSRRGACLELWDFVRFHLLLPAVGWEGAPAGSQGAYNFVKPSKVVGLQTWAIC